MLGRTHITAGITSALLIFQPATLIDFGAVVAGGALGGSICDIDCQKTDFTKDTVKDIFSVGIFFALILAFDSLTGKGLMNYIINKFNMNMLVGLIIFVICCIWGVISSHRSFTHSIIGTALISFSASLFYPVLGYALLTGMISHILLDLLNHRGIQLLYPLKKPKFCLDLCDSDGIVNDVLAKIGSTACVIMIPYFAVQSLSKMNIPEMIEQGLISHLGSYLIIVNVIAFAVFCANHFVQKKFSAEQGFWHTVLSVLSLAGGALGMLSAMVCLGKKIEKNNANMWAVSGALTVFWGLIFCIEQNPLNIFEIDNYDPKRYTPLLIYFLAVNVLTVICFIMNLKKRRSKISGAEMGLLFLSFIGGAVGGLSVIAITKKKSRTAEFIYGLPIMIVIQAVTAGYLISEGIL
ncbi:MAG: metal-dependent hydrolase [Ruminococcus sp.]|nr:metal-dependent hydrolase [Ruminococcus sp.]